MGNFKRRKRFNNIVIYIMFFIISITFSIRYLYKENKINDDTLVSILVSDSIGTYKKSIRDADFLLKYALNIDIIPKKEEENIQNTVNTIKEEDLPILYIYNTHDTEKYSDNTSVRLVSNTLKEYLNSLGINTIVEEDSTQDKVVSFGWKYGYSYKVSRMLLESAYKDNPSLKYFIDIHRDSSVKSKTTTEINGVSYARVLFVVGLDHDNYEPNLKIVKELKEKIDKYDSSLCRGIMEKSGPKVNGIYNQDFNNNVMLIEVGGQYNTFEEVKNTLKVLSEILSEFIKERENA